MMAPAAALYGAQQAAVDGFDERASAAERPAALERRCPRSPGFGEPRISRDLMHFALRIA
ncbi:MAG TPA: hypothetical protein DCP91_03130 [Eggerthellaceae bacterium]|nr:hypothetical protein [Eggerthellaceae bacterium]